MLVVMQDRERAAIDEQQAKLAWVEEGHQCGQGRGTSDGEQSGARCQHELINELRR